MADSVALKSKRKLGDFRWGNSYSGPPLSIKKINELDDFITRYEYLDGAGLASDPKAILFQTYSRTTGQLTDNPLPQANAYEMIQGRAKSAGITTRVGNHTFRATGVTAYLKNGGTLEKA